MRTIAGAAATEVAKKLGTEPLIIIEVDWGGANPTVSYADRTYGDSVGKILEVSNLDSALKALGRGSLASMTVTLSDTDNTIRDILNTSDPHLRPARVYQAFGDLTSPDKFLLFSGKINSPFAWSEKERTFTFDIMVNVEDREIGFSPEEDEFPWIADSAIGKAWPLCFGEPIRVPAVKLTEQVRGMSLSRYGLVSIGDLSTLCAAAGAYAEALANKEAADGNSGFSDDNYANVINSLTQAKISLDSTLSTLIIESPTQADDLKAYATLCKNLRVYQLEQAAFLGGIETLDQSILAATNSLAELQVQIYAAVENDNLELAETLKDQYATVEAQQDLATQTRLSYLAALAAVDSSLASVTTEHDALERDLTRFVLTQILVENGEKFPQNQTLRVIVNGLRMSGSFDDQVFTIDSILPSVADITVTDVEDSDNEFDVESGVDLRQLYCFIPGKGIIFVEEQNDLRCRYSPLIYEQIGTLGELFNLTIDGEPVEREVYDFHTIDKIAAAAPIVFREWIDNVEAAEIPDYASGIANASNYDWALNFGDEIVLDDDNTDVYIANLIPSTEIKEVMGRRIIDGESKLVPIPSQLYAVDLDEEIAGQHATTIRFIRPLSHFTEYQWTGDVFVTLISSEGPNTADVIQYLVETYTELAVDAASFASVQAKLVNYPSHFALLERLDALATIDNIAWQARCAVHVRNETVFLVYLAWEEAAAKTLNEDDIKDLELTFVETDALVTKLTATWRHDYFEDEPNKFVLRNNVRKYGLLERDVDFYIYNIRELVIKSATFWLIRLSNTWKRVSFTAWLDTLKLEAFDTVAIDWPEQIFSSGVAKGVVHKADYDSESKKIQYTVELAIRIGELTQYVFYWPANSTAGSEYPTALDLYAGGG